MNIQEEEIIKEKVIIRRKSTIQDAYPYGKVYAIRADPIMTSRIESYKENRKIRKDNIAVKNIMKTGLDVDDIYRGDLERVGLPADIEGMLDGLTREQQLLIIEKLKQKLAARVTERQQVFGV